MAEHTLRQPMRIAVLALALGLCACSAVLLPPNVAPVAPPSQSVEQANARLAEAAKERAAIEAEYAASEQVCVKRFFVNNCLEVAKEKRRGALALARAIEIEADHFKRNATADARDRALEEAARADQLRADARAAAPPPAPQSAKGAARAAPKPGMTPAARAAANAARLERIAAEEAAAAPERAARAAAFERKKQDSERRKRRAAEKQAQKAAKAASEE